MAQLSKTATRRRFLRLATCAAALPAAGLLLRSESALAADVAELDEADPAAVELSYKKDTTQVDGTKYPQHKPTQDCAGCRYYQGKPSSEAGPCTIFGGKVVHAKGWCAVYVAR